jgi:DNA repair exonuclease SbcCD ATPase subunit
MEKQNKAFAYRFYKPFTQQCIYQLFFVYFSNNGNTSQLEEQISILKADKERAENLVKSKQAQIEDLKQTNVLTQNDKKGLEARIETKMSESSTLNIVIAEKIKQIENLQKQNSSVKKCSDICEDNIFKISTLEKQWNKSQENIKLLKEETKLLERKVENCDCTAVKRKRPSN